jgi:hypothetical protein
MMSTPTERRVMKANRPLTTEENIWTEDNKWLVPAYIALRNSPLHRFSDLQASGFRHVPCAIVYLFSNDTEFVYLGECDRKDWGRLKAHYSRLDGKGFGHYYQNILKARGLPATKSDTLAAIRKLNIRWIEMPDVKRRRRLEMFAIALDLPLCSPLR